MGWALQTFGAIGSVGSLLVMPEVGGKYIANDKVEIGVDVASLPVYFNDQATAAQYRAMVYGGFRL